MLLCESQGLVERLNYVPPIAKVCGSNKKKDPAWSFQPRWLAATLRTISLPSPRWQGQMQAGMLGWSSLEYQSGRLRQSQDSDRPDLYPSQPYQVINLGVLSRSTKGVNAGLICTRRPILTPHGQSLSQASGRHLHDIRVSVSESRRPKRMKTVSHNLANKGAAVSGKRL